MEGNPLLFALRWCGISDGMLPYQDSHRGLNCASHEGRVVTALLALVHWQLVHRGRVRIGLDLRCEVRCGDNALLRLEFMGWHVVGCKGPRIFVIREWILTNPSTKFQGTDTILVRCVNLEECPGLLIFSSKRTRMPEDRFQPSLSTHTACSLAFSLCR